MKLYEVPRNSYIKIIPHVKGDAVYLFDHIDGMYSYCTDIFGIAVHLSASTEVEIVEGFK